MLLGHHQRAERGGVPQSTLEPDGLLFLATVQPSDRCGQVLAAHGADDLIHTHTRSLHRRWPQLDLPGLDRD